MLVVLETLLALLVLGAVAVTVLSFFVVKSARNKPQEKLKSDVDNPQWGDK